MDRMQMGERIAVVLRDDRSKKMDDWKWSVTRHTGSVLNRDGEWEYEPVPSSRDDGFLARTRYSLSEAQEMAVKEHHRQAKEFLETLHPRGDQ